jgi:hypothetical protein
VVRSGKILKERPETKVWVAEAHPLPQIALDRFFGSRLPARIVVNNDKVCLMMQNLPLGMKLALAPKRQLTRILTIVTLPEHRMGAGISCPAPAEGAMVSPRFKVPTHAELPVKSPGTVASLVGVTEPLSDPTSEPAK